MLGLFVYDGNCQRLGYHKSHIFNSMFNSFIVVMMISVVSGALALLTLKIIYLEMYCIVNKTGEYGKYAHYAHPVAFGKHYKCHRLTNSTNKRCIIIIIHVLYFYGFPAPAKFAFFCNVRFLNGNQKRIVRQQNKSANE